MLWVITGSFAVQGFKRLDSDYPIFCKSVVCKIHCSSNISRFNYLSK